LNNDDIINPVRYWLEESVIGLNLCPFAKREYVNDRVRLSLSKASSEEQLLVSLISELELLNKDDTIETTLLIHPGVLQNFYDYNDFLDVADGLLIEMNLEGIYQIASFHPDYQFADTDYDDVENFTNRSPYPLLHIIREQSLELALAGYDNADKIPKRNIALLKEMGKDKVQALFQSYFDDKKQQ
jgi:uncharacterized protein